MEVFKWKNVQQEHSRVLSEHFSVEVCGKVSEYAEIKLEQDPSFDYIQNQDSNGKDVQLHRAPLFAFDTDSLTIYMKYIPVEIKRQDLIEMLKSNLEGFIHLSMSEPMRNNSFSRLAWAKFENEHSYEQALQKIPTLKIDEF